MTGEKWFGGAALAAMLLLLAVCAPAFAADQEADPCVGWREGASETMFRVASAQSRAGEGLSLLLDLIRRGNGGEAAAQTAFERERKRFEPTVEQAVTASRSAAQEAKRLRQLLKKATPRCSETELHEMRWTQWWFDNHGPIVKVRGGYLAAARVDFARAQSIFEEVIASGNRSDNPEYTQHIDRAKRGLAMVKEGKVPLLRPEGQHDQLEKAGTLPPHPQYIPKLGGTKP